MPSTLLLLFAASLAASAPPAGPPRAASEEIADPAGPPDMRRSDAAPAGMGGPIEPVRFEVSAILIEGRKAGEDRWRAAVDPALERRYGPREPAPYNQVTIPF